MKFLRQSHVYNIDMNPISELLSKVKTLFPKKVIGLALSGGATFGAAHVGVLQVLEETEFARTWSQVPVPGR